MLLDGMEKNQNGVLFKTCTYCRRNDNDITNILHEMYREDNVEQIRDREKAYRESHKEQIQERKGLQCS